MPSLHQWSRESGFAYSGAAVSSSARAAGILIFIISNSLHHIDYHIGPPQGPRSLCLPVKETAHGQGYHLAVSRAERGLVNAAPVHRNAAGFAVLADLPVLDAEAGECLRRVTL